MINNFKKIVIKIGSSSIVNERTKIIKTKWLRAICRDIAFLHSTKKIIVVCSGAIALGSKFINEKKPIRRLEDKQAAAAVGQIMLANHWQQSLKKNLQPEHNFLIAKQINRLSNRHRERV
jgi:glutamate 5-kinase